MTKDVPTMHPFSRYENGSVNLHGTVTRTGNMQVHQDKNYRALLKDRILETSVHKKSYVKPVDANQVVQQTAAKGSVADPNGKKGFGEAVSALGKRILEANERQQAGAAYGFGSAGNKRMRFSDDMETKTIVFQLYEEKPFWTTKGTLLLMTREGEWRASTMQNRHCIVRFGVEYGWTDRWIWCSLVWNEMMRTVSFYNFLTSPSLYIFFFLFEMTANLCFPNPLFTSITNPRTADLRLHSGRSESEIKDVLKEIATYERSGENKNSWGLKKEYQVTKKSSGLGDGTSGGPSDGASSG
mmetsp:Transcript_61206/g.149842  ORF Transcript_61206/g.149842 Transcript_61206/m.149842 type:complete len:298 (-) Transcript_61206:43-936(-)